MSAPSGGSHKQEHERQEQDLKKEIIISHGLARNIQQGKYGRFDLLSKKGVRWAQTQQKKILHMLLVLVNRATLCGLLGSIPNV